MKKVICVLITLALLCLIAMPVQAGRLEDMQARYVELTKQKADIETQMIRLEGMFAERQVADAELKAAAEALRIQVEEAVATGEELIVDLNEAAEAEVAEAIEAETAGE